MAAITEIYKVNFMQNRFAYAGTLRNEKRFNINDKVFFTIDGSEIISGRIFGVELPIEDNPEYRYKVELPQELVQRFESVELKCLELTCKSIFNNWQEAKESAMQNLKHMAKLQEAEIEKYFSQFSTADK